MTDLYEPSLYANELPFSAVEVGHTFPGYRYSLTQAHIDSYIAAVTEGIDAKSVAPALGSPLLPSLVAINYGFIYSAMACRPPTGFLNSTVRVALLHPIHVGESIIMKVRVADKQIKRERNHVLLEATVEKSDGVLIAQADVGCIFP